MIEELEPLLTVDEAADVLKVSRWTVYRLIKERELVTIKVRNGRRIAPESVRAYIAGVIEDAA